MGGQATTYEMVATQQCCPSCIKSEKKIYKILCSWNEISANLFLEVLKECIFSVDSISGQVLKAVDGHY